MIWKELRILCLVTRGYPLQAPRANPYPPISLRPHRPPPPPPLLPGRRHHQRPCTKTLYYNGTST